MHAALVLAPLVVVTIASGEPIWLSAAIVSGSALSICAMRPQLTGHGLKFCKHSVEGWSAALVA